MWSSLHGHRDDQGTSQIDSLKTQHKIASFKAVSGSCICYFSLHWRSFSANSPSSRKPMTSPYKYTYNYDVCTCTCTCTCMSCQRLVGNTDACTCACLIRLRGEGRARPYPNVVLGTCSGWYAGSIRMHPRMREEAKHSLRRLGAPTWDPLGQEPRWHRFERVQDCTSPRRIDPGPGLTCCTIHNTTPCRPGICAVLHIPWRASYLHLRLHLEGIPSNSICFQA